MVRIRRANYIVLTWKGDHSPRHVHVYRDGRLVLKWDLDHRRVLQGNLSRRILALIERLEEEGLL
jgi:hypothetical protein